MKRSQNAETPVGKATAEDPTEYVLLYCTPIVGHLTNIGGASTYGQVF
jgi:hypothetical protein